MRTSVTAIIAATAVAIFAGVSTASAAPVSPGPIGAAADELSQMLDVRTFCYNRHTGRFIHWGPCRRTVPRVYCYNRHTGRFLHWGSCRR